MPLLPMFPLGTVLLPGMVLPLHVFEPRYRRLLQDVRAGGQEFGVVLIERGSEVGGGDVRTDIGTVARVLQAEELADGRWMVAAVGVRRLRVERWLEDDPYPRADVVDWPEGGAEAGGDAAAAWIGARRRHIESLVRRASARRTELGDRAPPVDLELADEPVLALYQATLAAIPEPLDRQAVLAVPTVAARAELVEHLLRDTIVLLEARLGAPG